MSPLRGLALALTAVTAAWGMLRVPWEIALAHPAGDGRAGAALVPPPSPIWASPPPMSVAQLAAQMPDVTLPEGGSAVVRINWGKWGASLLVSWVLLGAAAWPLLAWLGSRRARWRPAARFSLGLTAVAGLCLALWIVGGGWGPPCPVGFAAAAIVLARAVAAPEAGAPWLGMAPGPRPLALLALALASGAGLFALAAAWARPGPMVDAPAVAAAVVALGAATGLALAPPGQVRRQAWHLAVALAVGTAAEALLEAAERLAQWACLGLRPTHLLSSLLGTLGLLVAALLLIGLAASLVGGFRHLRKDSPCAT